MTVRLTKQSEQERQELSPHPALRRWLRRLRLVALAVVGLLFVGWRGFIWYSERTESFSGPHRPICGSSVLGSRYEKAAESARQHIQAMMAERQIPGLSAAVAVNGQILWSEGFGYADIEKKIPACPHTQYRIGSVSKLFTAAAMMRLYEQGRLDIDAPIQKYVPSFPDKGHVITARQLASHRAGIRDYRDDNEAINTKHYDGVTESLERFKDDPLIFPPDSGNAYSSYGYVLLSAAIEGTSGEDFLSYMHRHVFEPLGMKSTVENRVNERAVYQTTFYDNVTPFSLDGRIVESPYNDYSSKWASGGFLSTAEDLARFASAHISALNAGFLKPETIDVLFTPRTLMAGFVGQCLGWMTARDLHLRDAYFHFGAGSGGTAFLMVFPEQRTAVALLANLGHARFPFERLMGIANAFSPDPAIYISIAFLLLFSIAIAGQIRSRRKRLSPVASR